MKKILVFAAIAVVVVAVPLLSKFGGGQDAKQVELAEAEYRLIKSSILASGTLAFREQIELTPEVIGQVVRVHVEESDPVRRGDLVITLDPKSYQAQVDQASARVRMQAIAIERQRLLIENLEDRFERQESMFEKKLVDEDSFERLQNELSLARVDLRSYQESLSQAQAALNQADELLAKTVIRSPIDGIVIQIDVEEGETVIAGTTNIPGSTMMVIADPSETLTEVRVDEADIAQVEIGQQADIYAAAYPDTALVGTVQSIAQGLAYIAMFGIGSILGMAALAAVISLPLRFTPRGLTWAHNGLKALVGVVTIGLGCALIYELGFNQGLLTGA